MLTVMFSVFLCISIAVHVLLGGYTLIRCESRYKNIFFALMASGFLYTLGYLLEVNASTVDGGFTAVKVSYLGSAFAGPVLLIFVAQYCRLKISRFIFAPVVLTAPLIIALVWTTEATELFYTAMWFDAGLPVPALQIEGGPLYATVHIHGFACLIFTIAILAYRYIKSDSKERRRLTLLTVAVGVCIFSNILFLVNPFGWGIHYIVLSLGVFNLINYLNITKYDMFDIIPTASIMALQSMQDAFVLVDSNNCFLSANASAEKMFFPQGGFEKLSSVERLENWPDELKGIDSREVFTVNFTLQEQNHYNATISPIINKSEQLLGYTIIITDITPIVKSKLDAEAAKRQLEEIAYIDTLTGIMNRRQFLSFAVAQIERAKRLQSSAYIIIFDIDRFKAVNDTYGHLTGDKVLQCVAKRVQSVMRPYDLFGRYGGEEFAVFIPDTDSNGAIACAERMRTMIYTAPMEFNGVTLTVSASFGIAPICWENSLEFAISCADQALYTAKKEGRNRVELYSGFPEQPFQFRDFGLHVVANEDIHRN